MDVLSVELEIQDTVANGKIDAFVSKVKAAGREIDQIQRSPLNPSIDDRLSELRNPKRLEDFRQSIIERQKEAAAGFKEVDRAAAGAAQKAQLLNSAVSLLPPELEQALVLFKGISAETTILGAGVLSLTALLAAGVVSILAAKQITDDIRKAAENRLETEKKITAEWNRQHAVLGDIQKMLEEASRERGFNTFTQTASLSDLGAARNAIQSQLDASQNAVLDEMRRRQLLMAKFPGTLPKNYVAQASGSPDEIKQREELQKRLAEQLKQIDAQIYAERQRQSEEFRAGQWKQIQSMAKLERDQAATTQEALEEKAKAAKEAQDKFNKSVEEGTALAKRYGATWAGAFNDVFARANAGNPFAVFLQKSANEAERLKEQLKGLPVELQKTALAMKAVSDSKEYIGLQIDNAVKVNDLQNQAREFRQGYRNGGFPSNVAEFESNFRNTEQAEREFNLRFFNRRIPDWQRGPWINGKRLNAEETDQFRQAFVNDRLAQERNKLTQRLVGDQIQAAGGSGSPFESRWFNQSAVGGSFDMTRSFERAISAASASSTDPQQKEAEALRREISNQRLVELSKTVDPATLTPQQRKVFSDALDSEITRQLTLERDAQKERVKQSGHQSAMEAHLKTLLELAQTGGLDAIVEVIDKSNLSETTRQSRPSDTANRRKR